MSKRLSKIQQDTLADRLAKLLTAEMDINTIFNNWADLSEQEKSDIVAESKEFLTQAMTIANEFGARDFTVAQELGWPPRISVSFTWSFPVSEG